MKSGKFAAQCDLAVLRGASRNYVQPRTQLH